MPTPEKRRAYQRDWNAKNSDKKLAYSRNFTAKNPEKAKEYKTSWRAKPENREKELAAKRKARSLMSEADREKEREQAKKRRLLKGPAILETERAYRKRLRAEDPERLRRYHLNRDPGKVNAANQAWVAVPANREKKRKSEKIWRADHYDKVIVRVLRRRASKAQRTAPWVDEVAVRAIVHLGRLEGEHVDHIVPLGTNENPALTVEEYPVSGLHWELNLQLLPRMINMKKHLRMRPEDQRQVEEWRPSPSP